MGDDSITLGPQGGLARGMSVRGQPSSMQGIAGPNNGYGASMIPERGGYGPRDRACVSTPPQSGSSDKPVLSEDCLHDRSIETIKEFYSAGDEKEVALCIKDLNAPGFYPSMISIWVTDSFERKDIDRDSLAKLLVNLTKSQEGILTQDSLVRGFESVLSTLEDAVIDAPRAAEFLGRIFARILIENVIPYKQVWRLLHEGGDEQGQLVKSGLAADVLGVILEVIKSEKGDPFLNDVRTSSDLQLENFRPPPTLKKPSRSAGVLPSNPQMGGGFRGFPQQQMRSFGNQDPRFDSFENRTLSIPLRPMGDDSITLGPQGGLARGMSLRGQPSSMQGIAGPNNGYGASMIPERGGYGLRERACVSTPPQSGSSDKPVWSDDRLLDMSIEVIKEFYSARDEKEVALCVKELNAPGFYPSMISIWVTDSFERKDMDRDSLAKLLVNLTKSQEGILTQDSLVRGFESVLSTLEDAVIDAPKAAEFLGRIFARILIENVIPYKQVWRLLHEGGEEPGQLVESGHAADVLGVILEIIKSEKGEPFLNDVRASSDLWLENFHPPTLKKPSRLDKFI